MLRATAVAVGLLASMSIVASAQTLSATAKIGRALVNQHCGVCHTKPDLVAAQFGPSLDKALLESVSEADVKNFIDVGAPDMPGFAITLSPAQIDAIVNYVKETPAPPRRPTPAAPEVPAPAPAATPMASAPAAPPASTK